MGAGQATGRDGSKTALAIRPKCSRVPGTRFQFDGFLKRYLTGVTEQWLKVAPLSNPAMLEMFRDRDRLPRRDMVPWAGEFAGKYLTSAVQVGRVYPDAELKKFVGNFVARLIACQDTDGYLGPWPKANRLTGSAPNAGGATWDAWGHYHVMLGLLLWNEETGDTNALESARKIGDLLCEKFSRARLVDTGSTEMNLAVIHSLGLLYERTLSPRYLQLAQKIRDEFAARDTKGSPLAGDYFNAALAGKEFYQMPKPRWESLHPIMGLVELYWITGNEDYRRAFERIWWSIVKFDRHNNGGFSSGEQAQGNPYHPGAIETCCTIAWIALSVEMLRLTADSLIADEIELSTLNSVVGLHSPTGRWVTYNTPMDGVRKASAHDIVFQARAGSPELNCCSVNGARGFGMVGDWALMGVEGGLIVNWYGPSLMTVALPSGGSVRLRQETQYPEGNEIRLTVEPSRPVKFVLKLRVPHWSQKTRLRLNGQSQGDVTAGGYFSIDRKWLRGDKVEIELDFSLRYWKGEKECADKVSIYRGPLLLTYDPRFNTMDPDDIPILDALKLEGRLIHAGTPAAPVVLMELQGVDGRPVRRCDFGSAGAAGSSYRSWLAVKNVEKTDFSKGNPLRSGRAGGGGKFF